MNMHPDTRRMFIAMFVSLVGGMAGMWAFFWALERSSLLAFSAAAHDTQREVPLWVSSLMFAGLVIVNFALFFGVVQWSKYIRRHPRTYQLPAWALFSIAVVAGALMITAVARHSAFIQSHDVVPMDISYGFVAFQVSMGALVLSALVLLGVRWAPGYRPYVRPVD